MKKFSSFVFFVTWLLFFILLNPQKTFALSWDIVMNDGFGEGNQNRAINSLVVFGDYIYAGVYNATDGAKVFRSSDGTNWTQVNEDGFGDAGHADVRLFSVGNILYAGTVGEFGVSGFKLLKTTNGTDWTQIGENGFGSADNYALTSMALFGGKLYISVFYLNFETFDTGVRVYRIDSDSSWTKVNEEGFGDAFNMTSYAMSVFDNQLYVGTNHAAQGPEIWRTQNGTDWLQVADNGFGETNGRFFSSIFSFHQKIYASMVSETGLELWRSNSGDVDTWTQVGEDGFGNINNAWTGYTPVIVNDIIYFGTGNEVVDLAKIYISEDGENWTEEDNSSFVDASDEGIWSGTLFKNRIYFAIANEDIGARIIRSQELPSLSIKTESDSLPKAELGKPYSYQIEILNGTSPYNCTWSGDLPEGMEVTEDCELEGTAREASSHPFTVYLTDSGIPFQTFQKELTLEVEKAASSQTSSDDQVKITELPETGENVHLIIQSLCQIIFFATAIFLIKSVQKREKTLEQKGRK